MIRFIGAALALVLIAGSAAAQKPANVLAAAEARPELSRFVEAVKQAGLAMELQGEDPVTVFAPTDEAFDKLPGKLTEMLTRPENRETLAALLRHHIVPGEIHSGMIASDTDLDTLGGYPLSLTTIGDHLMVGDARIVTADIGAGNGVLFEVDDVLVPEGLILPASGAE